MKIVNRKDFLGMPDGTLYSLYEPCIVAELRIKDESSEADFCYNQIIGEFDYNDGYEHVDILLDMENNGTEIPLYLDAIYRDGSYKYDQLFLVYDNNDIQLLIDRLKTCLK